MKIKKLTATTDVIADDVAAEVEVKDEIKDELSPWTTSRKAIMRAISELRRVATNKPEYADKAKDVMSNLSIIYFDLTE